MTGTLYLLPGWSFDAAAFDPLRERLEAEGLACRAAPLPGHGGRPDPTPADWAGLAAAALEDAPAGAVWIGWSLGGSVALEALRRGAAARGVVLIAATPRFTAAPGWPWAVPGEELAAMQAALGRSPAATVRRFRRRLAQVSAADAEAAAAPCTATLAGLGAGLDALATADLRPALEGLRRAGLPSLWLGGGQDPLVPPQAVRAAAHRAGGRCRILEGAGHLPLLTHPGEVAASLGLFLRGERSDGRG